MIIIFTAYWVNILKVMKLANTHADMHRLLKVNLFLNIFIWVRIGPQYTLLVISGD